MELVTLTYVSIVVLFSFLSMLFISRFLPMGKSFEEMVKEKREMRNLLNDLIPPASSAAGKSGSKETATSGSNKKAKNRRAKRAPVREAKPVKTNSSDSDESELADEDKYLTYLVNNPVTNRRQGQQATANIANLTVEYAETEPFSLGDNSGASKKKDNKQQQSQQQQAGAGSGKKNKQKSSGGGILTNKSEPVLVKPATDSVPEINHFAEIHPKDALEIARQQKHEEESKPAQQPKEQRQHHGHKHKKEHQQPKTSPKSNAAAAVVEEQQLQQFLAPVVEAKKHSAAAAAAGVASVAQVAQKDGKSGKRKKNELTITQELLASEVADAASAANVQTLVTILNRADLPRNDIQILIDFLLNKQQDTVAKDPSEWNDPSDPLQKLKKQLQEKELALSEEQKAAAGLQAKLKELRQELNGEKAQTGAALKAYLEELNNKKQELHHLTHELATLKEKTAAEKHTLSYQFQQLQAKYIQLSKEHAAAQDQGSTIAQLQNDLQLLQQELMAKSQLLNEKLQSEEEMMKKKTEYEILLHNSEELLRQRVQTLTAYENELHQLRVELGQKDELSKTCQQQSYENEQLKAELQAKQKQAVAAESAAAAAAAANCQADESNRVEIRNLQNALDSTKSKLEAYRKELVGLKTSEENLKRERDEQWELNRSLRTKNSELFEALQEAQRRMQAEQQQKMLAIAEKQPVVDVGKIVLEEQNRTKDLLVKLLQPTGVVPSLPVDATDFQSWLETAVGCIKERQEELERQQHHHNTTTTTSSSSSNNSAAVAAAHSNSNNSDGSSRSISNITANNNLTTSNNAVNNSLHENSNDAHEGGGDANKNGATDSGSEDEQQALALRNEQLQKTVDQYKTIIADTENMLKNLEAKVIEQDIHWRSVVQAKEKELTLLKSAGAVVQ